MRSFDDEMELRRKQRERYFENPNFVMWSDIVKYYNDLPYEMISDEMFFDRYLRYCNDGEDTFNLRDLLKKGLDLPIDWEAFYAYFEERNNDTENDYKHQLRNAYVSGQKTVMDLLNEYRNQLLGNGYDFV